MSDDTFANGSGSRLAQWAGEAQAWAQRHGRPIRRYGLGAALVVFAIGLYFAIAADPELVSRLDPIPLIILTVISAPLGTVLNAAELWALSRIAGGPMSRRAAFELTLFTSAANMLPIPGGAITKLAGFKAHGVGYRTGTTMVFFSFLVWGGLAFLYSAGALALLGRADIAFFFALAGAALLVASAVGFRRYGHWGMVVLVGATRLLNFVIEGWRYWLALSAMGLSVSYLECSVFVVVAFIGAAAVVVPSGLGVSEAAGALIAALLGIGAATGFISTAIQRVARLAGLALMAVGFLALKGGELAELAITQDPADTSPER